MITVDGREVKVSETREQTLKTIIDAIERGYLTDETIQGIQLAIPKDQYETRLKADMLAMLTEIQLEIEEIPYYRGTYVDSIDRKRVMHKIQQKINALKADKEQENE